MIHSSIRRTSLYLFVASTTSAIQAVMDCPLARWVGRWRHRLFLRSAERSECICSLLIAGIRQSTSAPALPPPCLPCLSDLSTDRMGEEMGTEDPLIFLLFCYFALPPPLPLYGKMKERKKNPFSRFPSFLHTQTKRRLERRANKPTSASRRARGSDIFRTEW